MGYDIREVRRHCIALWVCAACGCGVSFSDETSGEAVAGVGASGSTTSGGGDASTGMGGAVVAGSGGGGGGASSGVGGAGVLVSDALLVRYAIDEADAGQGPAELLDSAPSPHHATISFTPALTFAATDGHRGLRFAAAGDDAMASVPVGTSKLSALDGVTAATIEVVVHLEVSHPNAARLVHFGEATQDSMLSMESRTTTSLFLDWNALNVEMGNWTVPDMSITGRTVVHLVLDTGQAAAVDRVRLYRDGVRHPGGASPPTQGATTVMPASASLVMGNRLLGQRTFQGWLYYAAVYKTALSDADIAHNATALSISDDGW